MFRRVSYADAFIRDSVRRLKLHCTVSCLFRRRSPWKTIRLLRGCLDRMYSDVCRLPAKIGYDARRSASLVSFVLNCHETGLREDFKVRMRRGSPRNL